MARRKNITLFFEYFSQINFYKDPFLVPYYLGKTLDYDATILYPNNEENINLPKEHRGVRLIPFDLPEPDALQPQVKFRNAIKYVSIHAKEIDVLMLFFGGAKSEPFAEVYKKENPLGKIYVKLDIEPYGIRDIRELPLWKRYLSWGRAYLQRRKFFNRLDVVSCETTLAYNKLSSHLVPYFNFGKKLMIVPNGIDEESIEQIGFGKTDFRQKKNIMLTVGRLGTYQKNTEMLLRALGKVDLKDWLFYMIGSVEEDFLSVKEKFMSEHPSLADKLIWKGPVSDRKELYGYYSEAKVFVLPSRYEGYAIVFSEAQRFGDYIISTPVGAATDVVAGGKYGEIVDVDDSDRLADAVQKVIDGDTNVNVYDDFDIGTLSWRFRVEKLAKRLK